MAPQPSTKALHAELERRELLIVACEAELNRAKSTIRRLQEELADREPPPPPAPLRVVDTAREEDLAVRERELSENATILAQREQVLAARERELEGREAAAEQRVHERVRALGARLEEREQALAERELQVAETASAVNRKSLMEREQFAYVRAELDERHDQLRLLWDEVREEQNRLEQQERRLNRAAAKVGERGRVPAVPAVATDAPAPRPAAAPAHTQPRAPKVTRLAEPDIAEATVPGSARRESEDEWWGKVLGRPVAVGA